MPDTSGGRHASVPSVARPNSRRNSDTANVRPDTPPNPAVLYAAHGGKIGPACPAGAVPRRQRRRTRSGSNALRSFPKCRRASDCRSRTPFSLPALFFRKVRKKGLCTSLPAEKAPTSFLLRKTACQRRRQERRSGGNMRRPSDGKARGLPLLCNRETPPLPVACHAVPRPYLSRPATLRPLLPRPPLSSSPPPSPLRAPPATARRRVRRSGADSLKATV